MIPLGMKGSKLLSDIIKDSKIPTNKKKDVLILEDENTILWCVGIRLGANGIANEHTKNILKINVK
jgi:tRNA(Ile)-lysidine synthase